MSQHWPGIAHLLQAPGLIFPPATPWQELPIAILDFETTGFSFDHDRVVEVGIAMSTGERFATLVNPMRSIPEGLPHGICNGDVPDAPKFNAAKMLELLSGKLLAAYNADFDRKMLEAECRRGGVSLPPGDWLDPLVWARHFHSGYRSRSLGEVCARLGIPHTEKHRALQDAEATLAVLRAFAPQMPTSYGEMMAMQKKLKGQQGDNRRWTK